MIRLLQKIRLAEVLTKVDEGREDHRRHITTTTVSPAASMAVAAKNFAKS